LIIRLYNSPNSLEGFLYGSRYLRVAIVRSGDFGRACVGNGDVSHGTKLPGQGGSAKLSVTGKAITYPMPVSLDPIVAGGHATFSPLEKPLFRNRTTFGG
jgi:hypothetical protein